MLRALREHKPFLVILAAGAILRIVILFYTSGTKLQIVDEQHYALLATSLARGHGYAFEEDIPATIPLGANGEPQARLLPFGPTSLRPPLYPAYVALLWRATGTESLQVIRFSQIVLSALNAVILYWLALRLFSRRTALLATALFYLYPSLIVFDYLILTEVLFTLLLTVFAAFTLLIIERPRPAHALAAGAALGLCALTRSVMWPFPLLFCPFVLFCAPGTWRARFGAALLVAIGYASAVGPWAARNTMLQRTFTVVDTMGGLNLLLGNYEHTPLDRAWAAVDFTGEKSIGSVMRPHIPPGSEWTEGQRDKLAQRLAVAYMLEHPWITIVRAVVKFADFWGLEREYLAALQQRIYLPPAWFAVSAAVLVALSYPIIMLLACLGFFAAPPLNRRAHGFFILLILFICGIHTVVFGHSRYHISLVPFFLLYTASAVCQWDWAWFRQGFARAAGPVAAVAVLCAIWSREVFLRDFDRIKALVARLFE